MAIRDIVLTAFIIYLAASIIPGAIATICLCIEWIQELVWDRRRKKRRKKAEGKN